MSTKPADNQYPEAALEEVVKGLDNLNFDGLMKLSSILSTKMSDVRKRETAEAKERIKQIAAGVGMSVEQILAFGSKPTTGTKIAVKYRDPENPKNEWSGRGRKPQWIDEALAKPGMTMEKLEVKDGPAQ